LRKLRLVLALAAVATFASGAFFTTNAINGVAPAPNAEQALIVTPWKDAACDADQFLAFKVEPVENGAAGPNGEIIISNADGDSFDWAIAPAFLDSLDISAVIVKGGPDSSIIYVYNDAGDDWDTDLEAALNSKNGKPYGTSHITFCFDKKG
jgi:hypothetical protein